MKNLVPMTAAVALFCGVSFATAAPMSPSAGSGSASSMSRSAAKDNLSLSASQQRTAWKDISAQAAKEAAPSSFTAKVGAVVPASITVHPVPVSTASKVPALQPYDYALLGGKTLLIVNPNDKKVAEIITQS